MSQEKKKELEDFKAALINSDQKAKFVANDGITTSLCRCIIDLGADPSKEYLTSFLTITKKLDYINGFLEIDDIWLSKNNISKLQKLSPKYLNDQRGRKLINQLSDLLVPHSNRSERSFNVVMEESNEIYKDSTKNERLLDVLIEQMNSANHDKLLRLYCIKKLNAEGIVTLISKNYMLQSVIKQISIQDNQRKTIQSRASGNPGMQDLTEQFLGEDVTSYRPLIDFYYSDMPEEEEPYLRLKPNKQQPLTLADLQALFCILKRDGTQGLICPKIHKERYLDAKDHPYDTRRKYVSEDFCELSKENVNVDMINQHYNLGGIPNQNRTDLLESLLEEKFFEIPESLLTPEFLSTIDPSYLNHDALFVYLKRVAKNGINSERIFELNDVVTTLFNKFSKHDKIIDVLESLPNKYFDLSCYTPKIFSKIPEAWLKSPSCLCLMKEYDYVFEPDSFLKGRLMFRVNEIHISDFLKKIQDQEAFTLFEPNVFWDHLSQIKDSEFDNVVKGTAKFFDVGLLNALDDQKHNDLIIKLYQVACRGVTSNLKKTVGSFFPLEAFEFLRNKVMKMYLPQNFEFKELATLKEFITLSVQAFEKNLITYGNKQFTKSSNGSYQKKGLTKKNDPVLDAFNELMDCIVQDDIINTLENFLVFTQNNEKLNQIGLSKNKKNTEPAVFIENFLRDMEEYVNVHIPLIVKQCLENELNLQVALLDDFFFNRLTPTELINFAKKYRGTFYEVMNSYRCETSRYKELLKNPNLEKNDLQSIQSSSDTETEKSSLSKSHPPQLSKNNTYAAKRSPPSTFSQSNNNNVNKGQASNEIESSSAKNGYYIKPHEYIGKMPNSGIPKEFKEYRINPDGNCGFTTLRVDRRQLAKTLLSLENDFDARASLTKVIESALKSQEIKPPDAYGQGLIKTVYSEQEKFDELFRGIKNVLTDKAAEKLTYDQLITWLQNNNEVKEAQELSDQRLAVDQAEANLENYCQTKDVFKYYIKLFVDTGLWLDYKSALLYAKQTNIALYIWRKEENNPSQLTLIDYHEIKGSSHTIQKEIHMLFTSGFTHFNLLLKSPIKEHAKGFPNHKNKNGTDDSSKNFMNNFKLPFFKPNNGDQDEEPLLSEYLNNGMQN
jgi:hypothetical protein